MVELVEAIQNKEYFKKLPPMKVDEVHNRFRYCAYNCNHKHDTDECRHLSSLVDESIKAGKLK